MGQLVFVLARSGLSLTTLTITVVRRLLTCALSSSISLLFLTFELKHMQYQHQRQ